MHWEEESCLLVLSVLSRWTNFAFDLAGLAFSSLSAAAAHGNFRKEEVDIDLHEGILTRTFENPVISLNSVWRMA